jgi:hypothetical protein
MKPPRFNAEKFASDLERTQRQYYAEANQAIDGLLQSMKDHPGMDPFQYFTLLAESLYAGYDQRDDVGVCKLYSLVSAAICRLNEERQA